MAEPRHAATPARRSAPGLSSVPVSVPAAVAFGLLVVLAASVRVDWSVTDRLTLLDSAGTYSPTPLPAATMTDLEQPELTTLPWAGPVFFAVAVLLAGVLLVLLARFLWRARPQRRVQVAAPDPAVPTGAVSADCHSAALRRGAQTALELLDEIADPQDAVIRSWLALEQAAASSGAPRRRADSPTEFARGLLAATGADRAAVRQLLSLYHRARFSSHPVGLAEVREARGCVIALSRSLAGYENALRHSVASARTGPPRGSA